MMTVQEFFKADRYAALSEIELLSVEPGRAKTRMVIRDIHLNAGNVVQGGAIFTLADFAFAAAINAYGNLAVSIETSIRYFKGVGSGVLFAEAQVRHIHKRVATFEVQVTNEMDELIALFTATAYRKDVPLKFSEENNPGFFSINSFAAR
jgi:acyl-CoA thioesterase